MPHYFSSRTPILMAHLTLHRCNSISIFSKKISENSEPYYLPVAIAIWPSLFCSCDALMPGRVPLPPEKFRLHSVTAQPYNSQKYR
jgi:hypothetical protein